MPLAEFVNCWQRIRRAQAHREAFAREWNAFVEDEPYTTFLHMEDDGTGHLYVEPLYDPFPEVFTLELGEMLYQLRAALDSAIYACAVLESGQDPPPDEDRLEFPLCDSPVKFKSSAWKIRPIKDEFRRELIESVQPYNVPEGLAPEPMILSIARSMGILNDWARKDRHRRLHVTGSWASNANPAVRVPNGCELDYILVAGDGLLERNGLIATFHLSGFERGMEVHANPDLAIDVAVQEAPEPCADNDTLDRRMRMMKVVTEEIVRGLEESFTKPRQTGIRSE